jgi:hypothetical protein
MPKKRHKPEEIVAKLRQVDVLVSQGQSVADGVRAIAVTEVTYYRWRQEYGGGRVIEARRRGRFLHEVVSKPSASTPGDSRFESWRRHYNTVRPHGSLGYKPPAPEVFVPAMSARASRPTMP